MAPGSLTPLLECIEATRMGLGPEQAHYSADLAALADDVRAMSELSMAEPGRREMATDRPEFWAGLPWIVFRDGIDIVPLSSRPGNEGTAALLRYRAGASAPYHFHAGDEHVVILSGSQRDSRGRYKRGTIAFNPAGSAHDVSSLEGCVVGIFWQKPVVFLADG
jgi:quercetin dioxygenase-like cupin family protein